jgi:hypothetical protein
MKVNMKWRTMARKKSTSSLKGRVRAGSENSRSSSEIRRQPRTRGREGARPWRVLELEEGGWGERPYLGKRRRYRGGKGAGERWELEGSAAPSEFDCPWLITRAAAAAAATTTTTVTFCQGSDAGESLAFCDAPTLGSDAPLCLS